MTWLLLLLLFPAAAVCYGCWDTIRTKRKIREVNDTLNYLEMFNARFTHPQDAGDAEDS